jgi:hypothetical protein
LITLHKKQIKQSTKNKEDKFYTYPLFIILLSSNRQLFNVYYSSTF